MTEKHRGPVPFGQLATDILDPVLRRRAGISVGLIESWGDIVGPSLSQGTRPERIVWPRRISESDPFEPAMLVVAAEAAAALRLQHETGSVIAMVNAFLGFNAIGRIRIVQKPVGGREKTRPRPRVPTDAQAARIQDAVAGIEDDGLRASLERLGRSVATRRR